MVFITSTHGWAPDFKGTVLVPDATLGISSGYTFPYCTVYSCFHLQLCSHRSVDDASSGFSSLDCQSRFLELFAHPSLSRLFMNCASSYFITVRIIRRPQTVSHLLYSAV